MSQLELVIKASPPECRRNHVWLNLRTGNPHTQPIQAWFVENADQAKKVVDAFLEHPLSESTDELCDRLMLCSFSGESRKGC